MDKTKNIQWLLSALFQGFQSPSYQRYVFVGTQFCYHGHWPRQEPIFLKTESLKFPKLVRELMKCSVK